MNKYLKEYKDIKDKILELEIRKEELEIVLFNLFDDEGIREKLTPFGRFCVMSRKSWEYSPKIAILQEKLSKAKKIEEISNVATLKKVSQYMRVVPVTQESTQVD